MGLISDLILITIDWLSDDIHTLCKCSLINKEWLRLTRHKLFNDLTIKLCVSPTGHNLCHRCIFNFTVLVSSRHCTIPRSIHTLRLCGKSTQKHWSSLWSLVGNPGGMQKPLMVSAVMEHFRSIERLEMVEINWFNPPWHSSRIIARTLSSVKSLTLDDTRFYGGPRGLLWMLDSMHNLDVLSMNGLSWPSRSGLPNNPPGLLIFALNAAGYYPHIYTPLYKIVAGVVKVVKIFRRPKSWYNLHKPLHRLALDIQRHSISDSWCVWLLAQVQALSPITTLVVSTRSDQEEIPILQGLLNVIDSLQHLMIRYVGPSFPTDSTAISPSPSLVKHRTLESLGIHISLDKESQILWLKNVFCTVQPSCLTVIRLTINADLDKFTLICGSQCQLSEFVGIDDYLKGFPSLQQLFVFAELPVWHSVGWEKLLPARKETEQLLRAAFGQCEAKGILTVEVTWGSRATTLPMLD